MSEAHLCARVPVARQRLILSTSALPITDSEWRHCAVFGNRMTDGQPTRLRIFGDFLEKVARGPGFEPRLTESESAVLPLNYPRTKGLSIKYLAAMFCNSAECFAVGGPVPSGLHIEVAAALQEGLSFFCGRSFCLQHQGATAPEIRGLVRKKGRQRAPVPIGKWLNSRRRNSDGDGSCDSQNRTRSWVALRNSSCSGSGRDGDADNG